MKRRWIPSFLRPDSDSPRSLRHPPRSTYEDLDRRILQSLREEQARRADRDRRMPIMLQRPFLRGGILVGAVMVLLFLSSLFFFRQDTFELGEQESRLIVLQDGIVVIRGPADGEIVENSPTLLSLRLRSGEVFLHHRNNGVAIKRIVWLSPEATYEMKGTTAFLKVSSRQDELQVLHGSFLVHRGIGFVVVKAGNGLIVRRGSKSASEPMNPVALTALETASIQMEAKHILTEHQAVRTMSDPSDSLLVPAPNFKLSSGEAGRFAHLTLIDGTELEGLVFFRGLVFYIESEGMIYRVEKRDIRSIRLAGDAK